MFVEQSHLPGQTTPSTTAGVRVGARACLGTAAVWRITPNDSRLLTPGNYIFKPQPKIVSHQKNSSVYSLGCLWCCQNSIPSDLISHRPHDVASLTEILTGSWKLFSRDITLITLCFYFRTGPDTVVLNASEPSKEKEKQGFFRAIKKKKKKSQMVCCVKYIWGLTPTCGCSVFPSMSLIGTFTEI